MGSIKQQWMDDQSEAFDRKMAKAIGLTQEEYSTWHTGSREDEKTSVLILEFDQNTPSDVRSKVKVGQFVGSDLYIPNDFFEQVYASDDPGEESDREPEDPNQMKLDL